MDIFKSTAKDIVSEIQLKITHSEWKKRPKKKKKQATEEKFGNKKDTLMNFNFV